MILCANPAAQFRSYQAEIEAAISRVLLSNRYILGPEVEALEAEFANFIGVRQAIGVANGTDALELALRALGIGPGDEVITVSHTAVATVAAIEAAGATPVLVDVDDRYYTLDPAQLDEVLSSRTRAVIAVHLYGQPANLDAIAAFCRRHSLSLVEDASQAHGALWRGKRVGSIGDIGCFSCYPTKNLGAIGDAGLVTTNDEQLANRVRMLREYGWRERYISELQGRNSRLDELQAAVLRVKLAYLDTDNARRQELADQYDSALKATSLALPQVRSGAQHVFHLYVVRTGSRTELMANLRGRDIHLGIHYPVPVHLQSAYAGRVRVASSMRVTERLAAEVLSLPMYPELGLEHVAAVAQAIRAFHASGGEQ
jgi:dTDP-4-amino-4,6-dideoxygalactose transaminase